MRLDAYLAEKNIYDSRTRAARAIKEGCVKVNGRLITKTSYEVNEASDTVECGEDPIPYVGRGALKLEYALEKYGLDVSGMNAVDIGASTGGFSEVLLRRNIASVAAVDVGRGQLAEKIKSDKRVISYESTDIRNFSVGEGTYNLAVTDVSFISVKIIIPHICRLLKEDGFAVVLIKPQFEVGRRMLNKKGVVKDSKAAQKAVEDITLYMKQNGFELIGVCESPVKGGDGNTEFICVSRRTKQIDV